MRLFRERPHERHVLDEDINPGTHLGLAAEGFEHPGATVLQHERRASPAGQGVDNNSRAQSHCGSESDGFSRRCNVHTGEQLIYHLHELSVPDPLAYHSQGRRQLLKHRACTLHI